MNAIACALDNEFYNQMMEIIMTPEEAEVRGKEIVTEVGSKALGLRGIEELMVESLGLSKEFAEPHQHALNKRFWRKIHKAHEAGNDLCQSMGWNEDGKG